MFSLGQIEKMNADEALKASVERYGWCAGKRIRRLEEALEGLMADVDRAVISLSASSNAIILPEPHDLRSLAVFLRAGHDAAQEMLITE